MSTSLFCFLHLQKYVFSFPLKVSVKGNKKLLLVPYGNYAEHLTYNSEV